MISLILNCSLKTMAEDMAIAIMLSGMIIAENLPTPILFRGRLNSKREKNKQTKPKNIAGVNTSLIQQ